MIRFDPGTQIAGEVSLDNMRRTLDAFSKLHRYTGSEQGEASVEYIKAYLDKYGVPCSILTYQCFRSLPVSASVTLIGEGTVFPALAAVFSGEAAGLAGELYYDVQSENEPKYELDARHRFEAFKGKIVLTNSRSGDFAYRAAQAGALGVINIWAQDEELLHHNTIGTVWGNPTVHDIHRHSYIPFVGVTRSSGLRLQKLCRERKTHVELNIKMDRRIVESSMPVVDIPGKSEKYILVSGHYDSWYEGITDNATANAVTLECARIMHSHRQELRRGVKVVFWSGHSDGRYAGSSWYVDNHWEDLDKNCVAHVNLDLLGGKNDELVLRATSLMEKEGLSEGIIEEFSSVRPHLDMGLSRAGDESFSGVGVPLSLLSHFRSYPDGKYGQWANCYAPWWHTSLDSLDKVDYDFLVRDAKINIKLVWEIAQAEKLPVDLRRFASRMFKMLSEINERSAADFDLSAVLERLTDLESALDKLCQAVERYRVQDTDDILKKVAGGMVRLTYTYGSPYYHDPAYSGSSAFHLLSSVEGVTKSNTSPETYLMLKTDFIRQCNRQNAEMAKLIEAIDVQIKRWEHATQA